MWEALFYFIAVVTGWKLFRFALQRRWQDRREADRAAHRAAVLASIAGVGIVAAGNRAVSHSKTTVETLTEGVEDNPYDCLFDDIEEELPDFEPLDADGIFDSVGD